MSAKTVKKQIRKEEKEEELSKILQFMGWVFVFLIIAIAGYVVLQALLDEGSFMDVLDTHFNEYTFSLSLLSGIGAGLCFSNANQIKKNPTVKKESIKDLIIGMVLTGIFFIFTISFFNWYNL